MPEIELPVSGGGGGGSRTLIAFSINVPNNAFEFEGTIVAPSVLGSSKVLVYPDTSSSGDENEMAGIEWQYSIEAQAGQFVIAIEFSQAQGGTMKFLYEVV